MIRMSSVHLRHNHTHFRLIERTSRDIESARNPVAAVKVVSVSNVEDHVIANMRTDEKFHCGRSPN